MLSACLGVSALAMTGAALASKDPERMPASAGQTEYDRTASTRVDVWERVKESASEEPKSLNDLDTEIGGQTIGVAEDGSARAADLYERLVQDKENTEFGAFLEDLDYYDEVLEDPEGDYSKLGPRISRLENMDYNWEPAGVSYSSWKLISVTELGSWEPAIGTQTTNFTQTRNRLLDYQRLIEKEERNIATQEVRVASSTYETDPRTDTISRNINVALGSWANVGGLHSCTTWSPATSTKPQGTSFTQTRTCKQNQQRNVNYTVASTGENPGGAWNQTRITNASQSRSAVGTKAPRECRYNYNPMDTFVGELDNPDSPSFLWRETKSEASEPSYAAFVLVDRWINPENVATGGGETLYPVHNATQKEYLDGTWTPSSDNYVIHNGKKYTRGDFIGTRTRKIMYVTYIMHDYELCWEAL